MGRLQAGRLLDGHPERLPKKDHRKGDLFELLACTQNLSGTNVFLSVRYMEIDILDELVELAQKRKHLCILRNKVLAYYSLNEPWQ